MEKLIGGIIGFLAAAYMIGFLLPDRVHVERQITVEASAEKIYALISDFRQWEQWSPWAALDPQMVAAVVDDGVGQRMMWLSDHPDVGNGSQEIIGLEPPRRVVTRLSFDGRGGGIGTFEIVSSDSGTTITWSFDAQMREGVPFFIQPITTYFGYFMDGRLGPMQESGLAALGEAARPV